MGMCWWLLAGCADSGGDGPENYVVRPEDTLYSIAWRHDLDYRDLARWNNIGADYRISIGQMLVLGPGRVPPPDSPRRNAPQDAPQVGKPRPIPETAGVAQPNSPQPRTPVIASLSAAPPSPAPGERPASAAPGAGGAKPAPVAPVSTGGAARWVWPTDRVAAPRPVPGGGILLSGRLGQDVRAANAGRVVYAGSGMRGYGNLIIIKHGDALLSAYAHNREMLVHDGQAVVSGEVIAHMGEGPHQTPILYFEIRQNGKPIDPLLFLPKLK